MVLPKIYIRNARRNSTSGFTLIELLVVMGILGVVGTFSLIGSIDNYRNFSARNERDAFVAALEKARSQSINNLCLGVPCTDGKAHGVHLESGRYTLFQGDSYATRDVAFDEVTTPSYRVDFPAGSFSEVVFSQLSGDAAVTPALAWSATIKDQALHSSTVTLNSEGRISWTN